MTNELKMSTWLNGYQIPQLSCSQKLFKEKYSNQSNPVVPNLFLTTAHFHFENFPWPYSQSIAQEFDPNFHQS